MFKHIPKIFGNRRPLAVEGPCDSHNLHTPSYGPEVLIVIINTLVNIYSKLWNQRELIKFMYI